MSKFILKIVYETVFSPECRSYFTISVFDHLHGYYYVLLKLTDNKYWLITSASMLEQPDRCLAVVYFRTPLKTENWCAITKWFILNIKKHFEII